MPRAEPTSAAGSTFAQRSLGPAADARLHHALDNASLRFLAKRDQAFAECPEADTLKDRARAVRAATLSRLAEHLERLEAELTARGAVVHWAETAEQARDIVVELARHHGARLAVKGKSMVTEEIGLNAALAAAGIDPVETDLGEYIVQLAGEPPGHILTPAIHKTQADVAELFHRVLGIPLADTAEELTEAARVRLREKFRTADIGITGANFAVAETGTLVVVENEGNARLALSLPRVHIAILGIEKVVPRLGDLDALLRLLPRNATGQKFTAYVSFVSGPRGPGDDGPDTLHVVLLDNGRSALLADPLLREALFCIRCGACLNVCPVFRTVGGHAYASAYSGPIGALLSPQLQGPEQAAELPFASSLCGACQDICPVRIPIPRLLLHWRAHLVADGYAGTAEQPWMRAWAFAMRHQWSYALLGALTRLASRLGARPGFAGRWARHRDLPPPTPESFRDWWGRRHG